MENKLSIFIRRFCENVKDFYNVSDIVKFLKTEIERKRKIYPFWRKKVRFSYASFKKRYPSIYKKFPSVVPNKNILQFFYHDDHLSKNKQISDENLSKIIPFEDEFISTKYFKKKFLDLFSFFLTEILPFEKKSLVYANNPVNIYQDIYFDFSYRFIKSEISAFSLIKTQYKLEEKLEKIIEYLFSSISHVFGMILSEVIPENFQVELISALASINNPKKIDFVITIRQRERYLKEFFLNSHIFQFSEFLPQIPDSVRNKLKMQKDLLYLLALDRYYGLQPNIISVLTRIQKKCISLGHITPLLDMLNFMFSRVEDSNYETEEILDTVSKKFTRSPDKRSKLLNLFNFCNKNAVLFGTFQSNNRSQLQEQYRLFFLFNLQYFGEGLQQTFKSDNILLPGVFKNQIRILEDKYPNFSRYFLLFERFLHAAFELSTNSAFKNVFTHIFKYSIDELNEFFSSAFLTSLNERLMNEIESYNQVTSERLTYSEVVEFIIKTIYNSITTIFLAENPLKASANFKDSISRYSPKNVALRALEILFFKEIPLSDNNWMNFNLSRNKEKVIKQFQEFFKIPKDYFFTDKKLLHISMKQLYSLESEFLLEEWLVIYIIEPFISFIDKIWKIIEKKEEPITLNTIFLEFNHQLSWSVINPNILDNLELICEKMAGPFLEVFLNH
ncbi:MAG: hypothetical protein EU530_09765 [Promethearchaeota archaeon]|nr:MAG: hypothetical protein EU530_09765 [Candidatus Lokiarchaeota archaeon]